jgi:dTDP-4-amino-4,6-dideoxygalactose transaminase
MDPIIAVARKHNLKVIEDSCQGHGAEYKGKKAGSLGDIGCFSFYFTKNLGAYGESGIITTSDPEIAKMCRMIRDHGQAAKYYHNIIGFNGRLDEMQAAILKVKLPFLDKWISERRRLAKIYDSNLPASIIKPEEMPWAKHVYYVYVIRTPHRDQLREWLDGKGISTGIHYPVPIHRQEAMRAYGGGNFKLPVTDKITGEILSLPMYPELKDEEINYICNNIREFAESKL